VRAPREQGHAQLALQILNRAAQRRLGHAQVLRGATDAVRIGNRDERPQVANLHKRDDIQRLSRK
jgi:hypothetical protein